MAVAEGTKAYNPQTGQTAVFSGGKWVVQGTPQMSLPQGDEEAMKALQQEAQSSQWLDQKARQFVQTMDPQKQGQGSFATGPAYGEVGISHIAENINPLTSVVGAWDPRMGALESISNQAWVHMRPQGSGAIRGYEASDFKDAFPNVSHWGTENQQIAARLHQDAALAAQKLNFIDSFIRSGKGDYATATQAWQSMGGGLGQNQQAPQVQPVGNPVPKQLNAQQTDVQPIQGPRPGDVDSGFRYLGGNPADPKSWAPVNQAPQAPPPPMPQAPQ